MIIYRYISIFFIVWRSIRGNPPLSTNGWIKMSVFCSIFYRFQFIYRYSQDLALKSVLPCLHLLHMPNEFWKTFSVSIYKLNINMVLYIPGNRKDMREITVYLEQIVKILTFWIILAVFSLQSMECQIGNLHILSQTNRTYQKQLKKTILFISKCYKNSKLFRNANSTNRKHFSWKKN